MRTQILLWILLTIHLAGLVVMAGTTVIDYITFRTFWKLSGQGGEASLGLLPMMTQYGAIVRIGGVVIIVTGIAMLLLAHDVWWGPLWFKIKLVLVALLVLNGMLIGNPQGTKFRKLIQEHGIDFIQQAADLKITMNRFYLVQLTLFFLIILVSVVKFDDLK